MRHCAFASLTNAWRFSLPWSAWYFPCLFKAAEFADFQDNLLFQNRMDLV